MVTQYRIGDDGLLVPLSPDAVAAGSFPTNIAADASGHVYVTNVNGDSSVWQYAIGADETLAPITPVKVSTPFPRFITTTGKYE